MTRVLLIAALLPAACGGGVSTGGPVPIDVAETCAGPLGSTLQVERGATPGCVMAAAALSQQAMVYMETWGLLSLSGWTLRFRHGPGIACAVWDTRVMDVSEYGSGFSHELHHLTAGGGHVGWCENFYPWEQTALATDSLYLEEEHAYLCGGQS